MTDEVKGRLVGVLGLVFVEIDGVGIHEIVHLEPQRALVLGGMGGTFWVTLEASAKLEGNSGTVYDGSGGAFPVVVKETG